MGGTPSQGANDDQLLDRDAYGHVDHPAVALVNISKSSRVRSFGCLAILGDSYYGIILIIWRLAIPRNFGEHPTNDQTTRGFIQVVQPSPAPAFINLTCTT